MDGYDRIEARIREDARGKIEALERETEEKLAALRAELDAQNERERAAAEARTAEAVAERRARLISAAEMEAKKLRLEAQQEVLGETFELALQKMHAMPAERQEAFLARLAHEASPRGVGALIFSAEDRALGVRVTERANRDYDAFFTLADETRPLRGGFVLSVGDVEVNCAYETLVRMKRDELEREAAQRLFG